MSNCYLDREAIRQIFRRVDKNSDGNVDHKELQTALSNGIGTSFNTNTVEMMIRMFDQDRNGTISLNEFLELYDYVQKWQQCFRFFDRDRSGLLDAQELHYALSSFGYKLSSSFIHMMINRFDRNKQGRMAFDDFIYACVCLQILTDSFKQYDLNQRGYAQFSFEQFLFSAMSIII
ncbi:Sorcin [Schistosoma japonicum]|uniref:Sorcin n=2 Tax=Schistosoma japonicum TaxID=6182 RepID=C7TY25_SCHJA|nr:Sorcin [Schistosoma japonicum]TNN07744.1 Sorcin [Schistosoma japonicum]TNN07745.1 Sorcin [Schistosoma japonicum]TNN07746.1 Sorcin [Schistosoma japonicum]CAX82501.1 Sorcin [Schistosoma japonicum]